MLRYCIPTNPNSDRTLHSQNSDRTPTSPNSDRTTLILDDS
ncbi:MAG: hypothetical protein PT116_05160 [Aphanizomenon gracile PMC638.10]|nr:hypothetical protein [Aphanizomenon gracile PMC638.10]